jgi:hypothetical protein
MLIAERWRIVVKKRELLLFSRPARQGYQGPPLGAFEDEIDLAKLPPARRSWASARSTTRR